MPIGFLFSLSNPHLLAFVRTFTGVQTLILDIFCTDVLDVAAELSLPAYFFFPTAASNFVAFLHLPALQSQVASVGGFKALTKTTLNFRVIQLVPASHLPEALLGDAGESCKKLLSHFRRLSLAKGIIVSTFCLLEERALAAISDGLCLAGLSVPPIYCVGPLVAEASRGGEKNECLQWLDGQPSHNLVFFSCGSMGFFSAEQLKEIAVGLERNMQRFLWVVRSPRNNDPASMFLPYPSRTWKSCFRRTSWRRLEAQQGFDHTLSNNTISTYKALRGEGSGDFDLSHQTPSQKRVVRHLTAA